MSKAGTATPLLYAFWRSSCTYRVRIALNLKQIPYHIKIMSIMKNLSDEYTEINPMRQVPALEIDGMILTQSLSILHYLEATRPHNPLLPADLLKRTRPVLYSFWRSSCSFRVRIALNLKGIQYDTRTISLDEKTNRTDEYKKLNPLQQIPVLIIDRMTLVQSLSILYYLDETRPENPLLPSDLLKRTKVREICEIINSGIQPLQNVTLPLKEEVKDVWVQEMISKGFAAVEDILAKTSGKYCVGDEITFADCLLVPQVLNARRLNMDLSQFSNIVRIDKELAHHPAFRAAHPYNQPDYSEKLTDISQ